MFNSFFQRIKQGVGWFWYEQDMTCLLCGQKNTGAVCSDCREKFFQPELKRCLTCGKIIASQSERCRDCESGKGPQGLKRVTSLGFYDGAWKEFIHKVKYKSEPYLLLAAAEELIPWVIKFLPPPDIIVPVPMHSARLAHRGYNQAEVLASLIGRCLGIRCEDLLARVLDTEPQTGLGRQARMQNLQGAFALKPFWEAKYEIVWLVDDVVTTGATLGECAGILRKNGVREVYAFCLGAGKEE